MLTFFLQKWKEMRSSFFILKLYQREWNRVKIHLTKGKDILSTHVKNTVIWFL